MDKLFLLVLLGFVCSALADDKYYNYRSDDTENGTAGWNKKFPLYCGNGTRQSPINIVAKDAVEKDLGALKFENTENFPEGDSLSISNDKVSYKVVLKQRYYTVSGGGLPGKFYMHSFHFHWGEDDTKGSEHTIDGKQYPGAIHFVNYNAKYADLNAAVDKTDGLAAIGVLLKVGSENPALTSFMKYAKDLVLPNEVKKEQTSSLLKLMPDNRNSFYRYNGSLTTPNCKETVTWTLFTNTMTITNEQLADLRKLRDNGTNGELLLDTFRPVQDLGNRKVYKSAGSTALSSHFSSTSLLVGFVLSLFAMN